MILSGVNTYSGVTDVVVGNLVVHNQNALSGVQTIVESGAALVLESNLSNEPILLKGDGLTFNGHSTGALRNASNNNSYNGIITLASPTTIGVDSGSQLTIGGSTYALTFNQNGPQGTMFADGSGPAACTPQPSSVPGTSDENSSVRLRGLIAGE